jgi:hypothetical protein
MNPETLKLWSVVKYLLTYEGLRKVSEEFPELAVESKEIMGKIEKHHLDRVNSTRSFHEQMHH